jgi:DnaJ-class molecular chaperone
MLENYQILGLSSNATLDDVKYSYKRLASINHPDKGGDQETFKIISKAYAELVDYITNDDIFDGLFEPNQDITYTAYITLQQSFNGGHLTIEYELISGILVTSVINIPIGIQNNLMVRYPNLGDNTIQSAPRGDLYVIFKIEDNEDYSRKNDNLYTLKIITVFEAIRGGNVTITDLNGFDYVIKVKPGTQFEEQYIIKGKGFYNTNTGTFGDFIVIISIFIPKVIKKDIIKLLSNIETML